MAPKWCGPWWTKLWPHRSLYQSVKTWIRSSWCVCLPAHSHDWQRLLQMATCLQGPQCLHSIHQQQSPCTHLSECNNPPGVSSVCGKTLVSSSECQGCHHCVEWGAPPSPANQITVIASHKYTECSKLKNKQHIKPSLTLRAEPAHMCVHLSRFQTCAQSTSLKH